MNHSKLCAIGMVLLAMLSMTVSASAAPLYGTTSSGIGASSFYTINPATGAATLVGAIGFNRVGAMDVHPTTGVIYAAGQRTGTNVPVIITINPVTGAGTEVGTHGMQSGAISDLSFRSDGVLFALDATGGDHRLYTVNLATGAATLVGSTGLVAIPGNSLGFDASNTLWHVALDDVYTLNQTTGARTLISGSLAMSGGGTKLAAMDFHPLAPGNPSMSNVLYALQKDGNDNSSLVTVNLTLFTTTTVGATNTDLDGLAWGPLTNDERLPVELASMNISSHDGNVLLSWRTASEVENTGFEVQRTRLNGDFTTIASYMNLVRLQGLGTSSVGKNYSFTDGDDGSLIPGETYIYRLVDVSTDGVRTEHPALAVRVESSDEAISAMRLYPISPNPVQDFAQVSFSLQNAEQVRFELYTPDGRNAGVVSQGAYSAGPHAETIALDGMTAGTYTLVMTAGNAIRTQRLVVVR